MEIRGFFILQAFCLQVQIPMQPQNFHIFRPLTEFFDLVKSLRLRHIRLLIIGLIFPAILALTGCKKKRMFNEEDAQDTVDARYTQGELDEVIKDINTVIMEQYMLRGKPASGGTTTTSICGASVDSMQLVSGGALITYKGQNCFGKVRSGSVLAAIQNYPLRKWKNQGTVLSITFKNYKVTRSSDGRSIQMDGTLSLRNESGGTWYDLWYLNFAKVQYRLQGEKLKVTFENGDYSFFSFDRRLTFTYANFLTSCLVEGFGSESGHNNLECWGENRKSEMFYGQVNNPYKWSTDCGPLAPVSGETGLVVSGKEYTMVSSFAVDKDGNAFKPGSGCPYGWKASWQYKKKTNSRIFSFY